MRLLLRNNCYLIKELQEKPPTLANIGYKVIVIPYVVRLAARVSFSLELIAFCWRVRELIFGEIGTQSFTYIILQLVDDVRN